MRAPVFLLASLVALVSSVAAADELDPARRHPSRAADYGPEPRIIVKLRTDRSSRDAALQSSSDKVAALAARAGLSAKVTQRLGERLHVLALEPEIAGESIADALERVRADAAVEYAELDRRRYLHALPNDPLYIDQWYLQGSTVAPAAIDAAAGWDTTTGSAGVVVAIIDTGVLFAHPDLFHGSAGGRLLPGYDFIADAAAANDGDGRDPDATDAGDWVTDAEVATPGRFRACDASDSSWHGTRVAGIIAARTNNSAGIAGTTWEPWILPVRALGKCGGWDSDIVTAMRWAAGLDVPGVPANQYPAKILNLSIGSEGPCPATYRDAIEDITARGALIVVSGGNEGGPVDSPANCAGVAAVAGLRHAGTKVGYSSLGPQIALGAPAGNCVNTGGACLYSIDTTTNDGATTAANHGYTDKLNYNVGTSFSAPIVSAVAALMSSANGNLGAAQLIARLKEGAVKPFPTSSDPTVPQCHVPAGPGDVQNSECNCTTDTCGAGIANVPGALMAALRPIASVSVTGTFAPGQSIELSGLGSAAACGYGIADYTWESLGPSGPGIGGNDPAVAVVEPPTSGSYTLRLTVTDDAGREDAADVVVTPSAATTDAPVQAGSNACWSAVPPPPPPAILVTVDPTSANVEIGASRLFTAVVKNASNSAVTWRVDGVAGGNETVGTITANGSYTAPASVPSPATVTVSAISDEDPNRSASAEITVFAPTTPSAAPSGSGGGGGALDLATLLLLLAGAAARRVVTTGAPLARGASRARVVPRGADR